MRAQIIRIGNSQGVRIPKPFLEQSRIGKEVEIELQGDQIVIRSAQHPREGWEEAFKLMAKKSDDRLIDGDLANQSSWDDEEWEW
jgi:antitoxin MazE